ncbi:MAG: PAS domain S-box protein [Promethearchaeota archaeon]
MNDYKDLKVENFGDIFNELPIPSFIYKKIGKDIILLNHNKAAKELTEINLNEMLGKPIKSLLEARSEIVENVLQCLKKRVVINQDIVYTVEKSKIDYNIHFKYIFLPPDRVLILIKRVRQLKKLKEQIKKSQEIYQFLFEYSISSMAFHEIVYDSQGIPINYRFTDVNPMFQKVLSLKRDDVIGKLATQVFRTEDPLNLEIYAKVAETLEPTSFVHYSEFWNKYFKTSAFSFEKGKFVTVFEDISDQIKAELKLIESEKKFRSIIENTSDAIVLVGLNGNYLYASPQYLEMLGIGELDYTSSFFQEVYPEDLELLKKIYNKSVEQKSVLSDKLFELRLKKADKSHIWVSCASKNYYNDEGKIIGFVTSMRDITEQKEAEKKIKEYENDLRNLNEELEQRVRQRTSELLQSEQKYREIIERNYDAYFELDPFQHITFVNKRICDLLEYSEEEMLALKIDEIIDPMDLNRVVEKGNTLWEKKLPQIIIEFDTITKHGKHVPVETALYLKYDSKKKRTGFYGLSREINVIKLLRESEEKFLATSEQSLMGIAIYQNDRLKYANKALQELSGYPFEESRHWSMKKLNEAVHPDDREFLIEQYRKKIGEDKDNVHNYQYRMITKSGKVIWVELYSKTITYNGKPAILVTTLDIDEKKRAQERILESELKYREAYRLNEIYKDIFTHDINNILQNVLTSVELNSHYLKYNQNQDEQELNLNVIKDQVRKGALLVSNVKRLSQIEQSEIYLQNVDVIKTLNKAIDFVLDQFHDKTINIKIENECGNVEVLGNDFLLDIFQNLLFNSVKHNIQANIEVITKISGIEEDKNQYIKVEFLDNGIGVEDLRKSEIFQRQIKEDRSVSGIGFGLLLTKKIVELFCGKIWVEDRIKGDHSKGSNFIILLPRYH